MKRAAIFLCKCVKRGNSYFNANIQKMVLIITNCQKLIKNLRIHHIIEILFIKFPRIADPL